MKLIATAYVAQRDAHRNTQNTAVLALYFNQQGLETEFVVGAYEGTREIAVAVTGFRSYDELIAECRVVVRQHRQLTAYFELDDQAYLYHANDVIEPIGTVITRKKGWPDHVLHESYTLYLGGALACTRKGK